MNVILLEKMGNLGGIGDQADVKAGFARNFLFPQGKAIPATKQNMEAVSYTHLTLPTTPYV